ncbi:hypothetical protein ACP70R_045372 [Stipagrostis hirtigluma subsp. patula]
MLSPKNLEGKNKIFIPVLDVKMEHWFMVVIDISNKLRYVLDSLTPKTPNPLSIVVLESLEGHLKTAGYDISEYKAIYPSVAPQHNIYDCGFHMLSYARMDVEQLDSINKDDIEMCRIKVAHFLYFNKKNFVHSDNLEHVAEHHKDMVFGNYNKFVDTEALEHVAAHHEDMIVGHDIDMGAEQHKDIDQSLKQVSRDDKIVNYTQATTIDAINNKDVEYYKKNLHKYTKNIVYVCIRKPLTSTDLHTTTKTEKAKYDPNVSLKIIDVFIECMKNDKKDASKVFLQPKAMVTQQRIDYLNDTEEFAVSDMLKHINLLLGVLRRFDCWKELDWQCDTDNLRKVTLPNSELGWTFGAIDFLDTYCGAPFCFRTPDLPSRDYKFKIVTYLIKNKLNKGADECVEFEDAQIQLPVKCSSHLDSFDSTLIEKDFDGPLLECPDIVPDFSVKYCELKAKDIKSVFGVKCMCEGPVVFFFLKCLQNYERKFKPKVADDRLILEPFLVALLSDFQTSGLYTGITVLKILSSSKEPQQFQRAKHIMLPVYHEKRWTLYNINFHHKQIDILDSLGCDANAKKYHSSFCRLLMDRLYAALTVFTGEKVPDFSAYRLRS